MEALINSPKSLNLARDADKSCDARFTLPSRPEVEKISDCPELMKKYCTKIFARGDGYKPFSWIGVKELTK